MLKVGNMDQPAVSKLYPAKYLAQNAHPEATTNPPYLLILNQPIAHFDAFARLWKHTSYRICADGGANRLFDMFEGDLLAEKDKYVRINVKIDDPANTIQLPNIIHGDLDSLRDDVRAYYIAHGVEVTQDHDQYSTDFGKTMQKISSRTASHEQRDVLVLGTLAGRVDQGLSILHEMIREETKHPNLRLWLFSESSLSVILKSPQNVISELQSSRLFTENVGFVPVWGPATITTTGLEWDVENWDTHMGGQLSTSNHVKADEIHVHTNAPILFTIERASLEPTTPRLQRRS